MNPLMDIVFAERAPHPLLWVLLVSLVAMPVVSVAAAIHHRRMVRYGQQPYWPLRIILLAALAVTTFTLLHIAQQLMVEFFMCGTGGWGDASRQKLFLFLLHCVRMFFLGVCSTAFCLALALLLPPPRRTLMRPPNPAVDADTRGSLSEGNPQ